MGNLANSKNAELTPSAKLAPLAVELFERKIWLPKSVYDALPWFYLIAGVSSLAATLYISAWFWVLPHYLLFSAACLHLSVIIFRRRQIRKKDID